MGLIKKLFQILITAAMLTAGSQAYRLGFAIAEKQLAPPLPKSVAKHSGEAGPATLAKSAQEARDLAAKAFGENHWAAHRDLKIRFYDAQRGFWIYAQNYDSKSDSGKKIRFWPVVFIWRGQSPQANQPVPENRNLIFGGGDEAIIDMSQPLGVIKPGKEPAKIVQATLSGNVTIRDDKGTKGQEDDLEIGPLADIQFDEPTLSIHSKSDVRIKDRDLLITGRGLDIDLWPRELMAPAPEKSTDGSGATTFTGAKTIRMASHVRIDVANVGKSNVLPGQARDTTAQIPAWLQCQGPMRIDMPRQAVAPKVGPPRPPEPTIATFSQKVLLQRGRQQPDQVTGDLLRAELFPKSVEVTDSNKAKKPSDNGKSQVAISSGPMTELDLRWARVTGDKVTLRSQAQGLTADGKELILKRPGGDLADEVFLRGTDKEPLLVERIEYAKNPNGTATEQIQSIENLTAPDVTIFDEKAKTTGNGPASRVASTAVDVATVVARGQGKVEIRNARNQPVVRSAKWTDQAVMVTEGEGPQARKVITLSGDASVWDGKAGTLDAAKSLVVWLSPRGPSIPASQAPAKIKNAEPTKNREGQASLSSKSYEIERVEANQNVRLVSDSLFLNAKDRLDVEFLPGTTTQPKPPVNVDLKLRPTTLLVDQAQSVTAAPPTATSAAGVTATQATKKNEPKVRVDAKRIWAKLGPNLNQTPPAKTASSNSAQAVMGGVELVEARLRGDVEFHQENADPTKPASQVNAQAVDLVHQGQGAYHLLAFHVDPADTANTRPEVAAKAKSVTVKSDQFELEGPILGLDQASSTAWVNGAGTIKQWIGSELLKQDGFGTNGTKPDALAVQKAKPQQATITWKKRMDFFGKPSDAKGNLLDARAHFQQGVIVRTEDALLSSEQLDTYFDQRIDFNQMNPATKLTRTEGGPNRPADEKPQIMFVDAKRNVTILNRRRDANTQRVEELQRVEGPHVMYDKNKDMVQVEGSGVVRLYQRREGQKAMPGLGGDKKAEPAKTNPSKPFNLTRVMFYHGMQGRLGYDPSAPKDATTNRSADFFGNVQVINGQVSDEFRDLNVDKPPTDFVFLSSEWLEVESLGDPANPKEPRNLIRAKGTATARSATMSTQGDEIRFDSREELFHVVGSNGREVTLAHQTRPGEPPSIARGTALVFNNKTGESELVDPKNIQLIDPNSGNRPGIARANPESGPAKPNRTPLRLPPSSNKERRSF